MAHRALFGYSVILIILKLTVLTAITALPAKNVFSSAITAPNIVLLTNQTRREIDLPALNIDEKLAMAAQAKADHLVANQYFAHTSPDGLSPWHWIKTYGYDYRSAGENLAVFFNSAEDVTSGWIASPTHRANIVSDRFTEIGVGVAQGTYDGYPAIFVAQMFGHELDEPTTESTSSNEPYSSISTKIIPRNNAYDVQVSLREANDALISLSDVTVPLVRDDNNLWSAQIPYNPENLDPFGEWLTITIQDLNNAQYVKELAYVLPNAQTADLFAFTQTEEPRLLGIVDFGQLENSFTKFYVYTAIALGLLLLTTMLLHGEARKSKTIAHTLAVMVIALLITFL